MHPIWQEMAKEFNKVGNQEVVIAEVNCEKERDLCYGKVFVLFSEGNKCSLIFSIPIACWYCTAKCLSLGYHQNITSIPILKFYKSGALSGDSFDNNVFVLETIIDELIAFIDLQMGRVPVQVCHFWNFAFVMELSFVVMCNSKSPASIFSLRILTNYLLVLVVKLASWFISQARMESN